MYIWGLKCNDPSAGSPTDTLLRLLLPLNETIRGNSQTRRPTPCYSLSHSIGNSDGRCVQRPETYSILGDDKCLQEIPRSRRIITIVYPQHDMISKISQPSRARGSGAYDIAAAGKPRIQKTYWSHQCIARAAQNIWEHHGPFIAPSFPWIKLQ